MCDDALVSVADHQTLRVLEGRYLLERAGSDVEVARDGEVLAVVLIPVDQVNEAFGLLRRAGHRVVG